MQSNLIATVPGNAVAGMEGLDTYALPFKMPQARVRQFWHRRAHTDAAHKWLRQLIAGLILSSMSRTGAHVACPWPQHPARQAFLGCLRNTSAGAALTTKIPRRHPDPAH